MLDKNELEKVIKTEIGKHHRLGEHAGGSGHLGYRSIIKFDFSEPSVIEYEGKDVYEVICKFDIYIETEFLHPPENNEYYTEHYHEKFLLDKNNNLLKRDSLQ